MTSTPINPIDRVSMEGGSGPVVPGQAPAVSYRLVKFDSSGTGIPGDTPGRFMLSGESATASTNLFQTASLAKSKKVATASTAALHCAPCRPVLLHRQHDGRCLAGCHCSGLRRKHELAVHKTMLSLSLFHKHHEHLSASKLFHAGSMVWAMTGPVLTLANWDLLVKLPTDTASMAITDSSIAQEHVASSFCARQIQQLKVLVVTRSLC